MFLNKCVKLIKLGNLIIGDFMRKKIRSVLLILFFLILYIYVCNITLLPNNIVVFQGEEINLKTLYGLKINAKKRKLWSV